MKERRIGMFFLFTLILSAFHTGGIFAETGNYDLIGVVFTVLSGSVLGGIIWSKR